jgi:ATP-dependent RNA helicase RhlE
MQNDNAPEQTTTDLKPTWGDLKLNPELLELIRKAGYTSMTAVQEKSIPEALKGKDLIVSAQTGSGKTAAFVLPLVEKLKGREGTYAVVLAPSREIALQTQEVLKTFGGPLGVRSCVLIGGVQMRNDDIALATYPQVIVATPGRLCDHLDRGNIWLEYIEMVVLDEADRMLDMGFADQLNRVLQDMPKTRQTLLFSATFSKEIESLARRILQNPVRVEIGSSRKPAQSIEQKFIYTDEASKLRALQKIIAEEKGSIFIFTRSKVGASKLWRSLRSRGFYDATHMHSDLRQKDREQALEDFKAGTYRVMIATDVIGRGIHVEGVAHVVNYDLPREPSEYIHRIGRTGRADAVGKATSLVTANDRLTIKGIEKLIGRTVEIEGMGSHEPSGDRTSQKPQGKPHSKPHSTKKPIPSPSNGAVIKRITPVQK